MGLLTGAADAIRRRTAALGALLAFGAGGLTACFPPPYEELGRRCDVARLCSSPLVCCLGRCATQCDEEDGGSPDAGTADGGDPDAGADGGEDAGPPPNLLPNPGFEAPAGNTGGVPAWRGNSSLVTVETTRRHSGQQAARVTGQAVGPQQSLMTTQQAPVEGPRPAELFCAQAWVFVAGDGGSLPRMQFREFDRGTPIQTVSNKDVTLRGQWEQVVAGYTAQGLEALELRFFQPSALQGDYFLVDDAELWRSSTGGCEPR